MKSSNTGQQPASTAARAEAKQATVTVSVTVSDVSVSDRQCDCQFHSLSHWQCLSVSQCVTVQCVTPSLTLTQWLSLGGMMTVSPEAELRHDDDAKYFC